MADWKTLALAGVTLSSWNIDEILNSLGHLQLFKYKLIVHANDLFFKIKFLQVRSNVTTKEESNSNRLDQMTEQNIAKT